jgi:hypothetical protein
MSITKGRGFPYQKAWFEGWKQLKDAGRRWISEIAFSSIKRVLAEPSFFQRISVLRKQKLD